MKVHLIRTFREDFSTAVDIQVPSLNEREKVGFRLNIILSQLLFQFKKETVCVLKIHFKKADGRECTLLLPSILFVRIETLEIVMTFIFI